MMRIEGHWETVDTLEDVTRVIREYYNSELADILEELIPEDKTRELAELDELRWVIDEIRDLVI
jgi:hypothetical protein